MSDRFLEAAVRKQYGSTCPLKVQVDTNTRSGSRERLTREGWLQLSQLKQANKPSSSSRPIASLALLLSAGKAAVEPPGNSPIWGKRGTINGSDGGAMKLLHEIFGTGPLVVTLSLLACIGFAAYSLELAPTAYQRLEIENRFR